MQIAVLVAATLIGQALAIPPGLCADGPSVKLCGDAHKKRAVCNHDNLLRSFLDPRYSVSATSFCSNYIQQTTTIDTTTTTILTASALQKRASTTNTDFAGITSYGSSRLSSACTCIISPPPTATQAAATVTVTVQPGTGTCGLGPGFTDGTGQHDNFIGYLGTASSLSGCKDLCTAYGGCKAYALGDTACYGYSDVLANDLFYPDSSSPYLFFDLTCQY